MSNPAPGFKNHPDHGIVTGKPTAWVSVRLNGTEIAHSKRAVRLDEQGYPVRYYVPMEDVAPGVLSQAEKSTHCPFKGDASYFDVKADGSHVPAGAWSYERPYDEMTAIGGHVAFDGPGIDVQAFET